MNNHKFLIEDSTFTIETEIRTYEENGSIFVSVDFVNCVISVDNQNKDLIADVFYKDSLLTGLAPGSRMSFGNLRYKKEDVSFSLRSKIYSPYEDDRGDCDE